MPVASGDEVLRLRSGRRRSRMAGKRREGARMPYKIMIMGASYGSLLASKILFGGHQVHLICLPAEADLINTGGFPLGMPIPGRREPIEIDFPKLPGTV